ncbi:MAG TPA: glycosyltransferase family 87 protein [Chitinophaga sp.]|uniref:glycosyltransferase family 87 protein n=1 Tax=Chitinophaga sp. TaxID=1869181 RepID=UPI002D0D0F4F|nr:glycosyltransferase family 87 protein [Chitinophaga sp.]HVI46726.1 glycosyltransferase family 87 protein [Chitinophaga sp.]
MREKRNVLTYLGEKEWLILFLWFGLAFLGAIMEISRDNYNNFLIFKNVFFHVLHQQSLYVEYPADYYDVNLYGPVFSIMIAPFAGLETKLGALLWALAGAAALYYAIRELPLTRVQQNIILLLCSQELMGSSGWFQLNQFIGAFIILTFTSILKGRDLWAAFFVVLGTLTKFYGIVGLAFIFFSSNPKRFIGGLFLWGAVLFALPMVISSPQFIINSYYEWYAAIVHKNSLNLRTNVTFQDLSAGGFIKRVFRLPNLSSLAILVPAVVLFLSQYIMLKYRYNSRYRLYLLCSVLMFPVLFSSSSESPTYIIAIPAICIWYVIQQPVTKWTNIFLFFSILLVSFSHSDVVTPWVRKNLAVPYALKALPCLVLWLRIVYEILSKKFLLQKLPPVQPVPVLQTAGHL